MWWLATAFAAELSGTLVGANGEPIVGATVYAYDSRFNYAYGTTRNGGEWSIVDLPADGYRIRFLPPNFDPHGDRFYGGEWDTCAAETVNLATDESAMADLAASLDVGASVQGRVVDLAGQPIAGMRVTIYGAEARTSLIAREDTTDEDGVFGILGLDAEASGSAFYVQVQGDGWPEQWAGPVYVESESERGSFAAGMNTNFGDIALLDGIRISGIITGASSPVTSGATYVYSSQQVITATIATDGTFVADGLPPGDVVAWASSPGFATTYYPNADRPGGTFSVPGEGDDASVDLDLPVESTLTLHATGEGDLGEVSVLLYNDTYTVGRGDHLDAAGETTIPGLYPGDYYVYVYGQDGGFTSGFLVDDGGDPLVFPVHGPTEADLALERGATLSGTITDDRGEPVYGANVQVTETTTDPRRWSATTARDGTYVVRGVDATTVTLGVAFYWYCPSDPGWASIWYTEARVDTAAGVLLVANGDELDGLDLVLPHDDDHDSMGDVWELEHGLDPTHDDAAGDPDGDGFTNAEEWQLDTDPNEANLGSGQGDCEGACSGGAGGAILGCVTTVSALRRRRDHQT